MLGQNPATSLINSAVATTPKSSSENRAQARSLHLYYSVEVQRARHAFTGSNAITASGYKKQETSWACSLDTFLKSDFEIGDIVEGKFRLEALIGAGASGAVYRATHLLMDTPTALKISSAFVSQQTVEQVRNEARILTSIEHPGVAALCGFGTVKNHLYLSFQLIEGKTLAALIKEKSKLSPAEAWPIITELAEAFSYVHSKNILHRDIKPSNVMITGAGNPVIIDFGIARQTAPDQNNTSTLHVVGTPLYMAPEVCSGARATVASDIYAFGCLMYECLTGAPPFGGDSPFSIMLEHMKRTLPDMPTFCEGILTRCMAKAPEKRYQSFDDLLKDLKEIDISCAVPEQMCKVQRTTAPAKSMSILFVTVVLCAAILTLLLSIQNDSNQRLPTVLAQYSGNIEEADLRNKLLSSLKHDRSAGLEDRAKAYQLLSLMNSSSPEQSLSYNLSAGQLLAEQTLPHDSAFTHLFAPHVISNIHNLSDANFSDWEKSAGKELTRADRYQFKRLSWIEEITLMIQLCQYRTERKVRLERLALAMGEKAPSDYQRFLYRTHFLQGLLSDLIALGKSEEAAQQCLSYMTKRKLFRTTNAQGKEDMEVCDVVVYNTATTLANKPARLNRETKKILAVQAVSFQKLCATTANTNLARLQWLDRLSEGYSVAGDERKRNQTIATALEFADRSNITDETCAHLLHKQAHLWGKQGRHKEALACLEKAYRCTKNVNRISHVNSAEFLGQKLVESGRPNEALPYFQEADALLAKLLKEASSNNSLDMPALVASSNLAAARMASLRESRGEFRQGIERIDQQLRDLHRLGQPAPTGPEGLQELHARLKVLLERKEKGASKG